LTQNRYVLAAGNPVSFVEVDGHAPDKSDVQSGFRSRSDPRAKKESRAQDADWEKLTNAWHRSAKNERGERGAIPAETPSEAGGFLNALTSTLGSVESRIPDPGGLRQAAKCVVGGAVDANLRGVASCAGDLATEKAKMALGPIGNSVVLEVGVQPIVYGLYFTSYHALKYRDRMPLALRASLVVTESIGLAGDAPVDNDARTDSVFPNTVTNHWDPSWARMRLPGIGRSTSGELIVNFRY
jgi:hypothetical protein